MRDGVISNMLLLLCNIFVIFVTRPIEIEVLMKQSIIAFIITGVVTICGGSLGMNKPSDNVTNATTSMETTKLAQEIQSTTNCQETTKPQATVTPQETGSIQTTAKPQVTTSGGTTTNPQTTSNNTNTSFAKQVVELVNKERSKAGLNALSIDENIETAAMVRSREIEKSFSHTRPNGSSFSTALSESGVKFMGAGENIAWGQRSPEEVMNGWMNSSGHRANILNSSFKKIGVAYYVGANGRTYWTQLFTY